VIQSFQPGEATPEEVNEAGLALAEKIAPGHESMVYTHTDKDHLHNHIIINSVNTESGRKYQAHGKEAIEQIRVANDDICRERGLSLPEKGANLRYTLSEKEMSEQGKWTWKDEVREKVDLAKGQTQDISGFKAFLEAEGVEAIERGKNFTYRHLETNNKVRGAKLGQDYEKETIVHEFEQPGRQYEAPVIDWNHIERKTEAERSREAERTASRTARTDGKEHESDDRAAGKGTDRNEEESPKHERLVKKRRKSYGRNKGGPER
jgi:hypothetical protein